MLEVLGARICQAMLWSLVGVLKLLECNFCAYNVLNFREESDIFLYDYCES